MTNLAQPFTPPMQSSDNPEWQAMVQRFWRVDPVYVTARTEAQRQARAEAWEQWHDERKAA